MTAQMTGESTTRSSLVMYDRYCQPKNRKSYRVFECSAKKNVSVSGPTVPREDEMGRKRSLPDGCPHYPPGVSRQRSTTRGTENNLTILLRVSCSHGLRNKVLIKIIGPCEFTFVSVPDFLEYLALVTRFGNHADD